MNPSKSSTAVLVVTMGRLSLVIFCLVAHLSNGVLGDTSAINAGITSVECGLKDENIRFAFSNEKGMFVEVDDGNGGDSPSSTAAEGMGPSPDQIERAKTCWCTQFYDRPAAYCPEHFTSCIVKRDDGGVKCYELSKSENFLRGLWPIALFWYGLLGLAFFCSHRGQAARAHLGRKLRACFRQRTEEEALGRTIDEFVENEEWFKIIQLRRCALLRQDWVRKLEEHRCTAWLAPFFRLHEEPDIEQVLAMAESRGSGGDAPTLVLKVKAFVPPQEDTLAEVEAGETADDAGADVNDADVDVEDQDETEFDNGKASCAICFKTFQEGDIVGAISCGHLFHKECLKDWLRRKNSCPLCQRSDIAELRSQENPKPPSDDVELAATTDSDSDES